MTSWQRIVEMVELEQRRGPLLIAGDRWMETDGAVVVNLTADEVEWLNKENGRFQDSGG